MTDENINEVREEKELKDERTNTIQEEIMDKISKIREQKDESIIKSLPIFNKYRRRRRKKTKNRLLDDANVLEADIIKEREEELKKSMRAF